MLAGTAIPQYAFDVDAVDVEVVLGTLISTSNGVVEEIAVPCAYVTVLVATTCWFSGMVEVAEFGQSVDPVYDVHIDSPVTSLSSPTFPVAATVVVAIRNGVCAPGSREPYGMASVLSANARKLTTSTPIEPSDKLPIAASSSTP